MFVGHVHVEWLVQGKLSDIVVIRRVDTGVAGVDQVRLQPCGKFKHVSNPICPASRGPEGIITVVPEVDAICIVAPFLFGE